MRKNKIVVFGIVALVVLFALSVASAQNEVYLFPKHSSAQFCNTIEVQIWANTTDTFGAGQVNLTYTHCCANVTNLEYAPLWQGTWDSSINGKEWLVFIRPLGQPTVSGTVLIGNLTIHCCSESACVTPLTFSPPSKLNDPITGDLTVTWTDGTFNCPTPTPTATPPPNGGGPGGGGGARTLYTPTPTLIPTLSPTPTPSPSPTPTSTPSPTPSLTPTSTPLPTPKPRGIPGFEAFFAILGLLAVAYLLRRE